MGKTLGKKRSPEYKKKSRGLKRCPLCNKWLEKGERVFTEAYPGKNDEKIVYLYGCPYCKDRKNQDKRCPVCHKKLPIHGYLIGKMWDKEGKIRVHISCCIYCRKNTTQ